MAGSQEKEQQFPITEVGKHPEPGDVADELASVIQVVPTNIQAEPDLQQLGIQPIGQAQLDDNKPVVLPLTSEEITRALHIRVKDKFGQAMLWLAEWCVRIAKLAHHHGRRVIFGEQRDKT
ncbi:hypothetical protein HY388_00550 [Candidatus Daviesbacteria bacterium]|nr:hypothetical protein [Candidatus Daviesbacteria bacterium]